MRSASGAIMVACLGLVSCGSPAAHTGGYLGGDGDLGGGNGSLNGTDGGSGSYGDGDGDGNGGDPSGGYTGGDGGACESHVVTNSKVTPEMLIVLDRSGSMKMGKTNRWDPSVTAIDNVTKSLQDSIEFGLMVFPGADSGSSSGGGSSCTNLFDPSCWTSAIGSLSDCQAGTVAVPIGIDKANDISTALAAMSPNGGTPTAVSLQAAHQLLGKATVTLDSSQNVAKYVLLVTDGEPNCTIVSSNYNPDDYVGDTVNQIKSLASDGIKTYVIGYNTTQDPEKSAMDMMAAAGDTGMTTHIDVENGDDLQKAMEDIAGKAASCTVVLDKPVDTPQNVLVTIDQQRLIVNQPDGNGFTISSDMKTVTVEGTSCEMLKSSSDHVITVNVLCQVATLR
jgi:hypothetical protein